ncbi:MAG: YggU family protein [Gammaproteobacteria bacterium]|nr:YggU family protein [Gammaproteobacteria bacterium]
MAANAYRWQESNLILNVYVQPNSRMEGYDGLHDQQIKLRISSPATEGKANQRLVALLAELFAVPKRSVELLKGEKSRNKVISIRQPRKLPDWITA